MEEVITAAEANRNFSRLLKGVREGRTYLVTSHGAPVAKLVPADAPVTASDDDAVRALLDHLEAQPVIDVGPWSRDELYDDDA